MLLGTVLRIVALGSKSLWLDEAASFEIARQNLAGLWHSLVQPQGNASIFFVFQGLYHFLLHYWMKLGSSEWMLRFPSAVFLVLGNSLLYFIWARFGFPRGGMFFPLPLGGKSLYFLYFHGSRGVTRPGFF